MKTIVISGEKSGVGKTYFAQQLLRCLPGWSALKVTVRKNGACPHGKNCGICSNIKKPFQIVKNHTIINQRGKDTARLKDAGAKKVLWLQARPHGLKRGLEKAFSEFAGCRGLIIEGTSVLKFFTPDLNIHLRSRGAYTIRAKEAGR